MKNGTNKTNHQQYLLKYHQPLFKNDRSVFVGADKITGEIVALKRINTEEEENGFPITAIREVKILKALHHENVVDLKEIERDCNFQR